MGGDRPQIEFPSTSPHGPEITALVQDIAADTYSLDVPRMKIFFYVDGELEVVERDAFMPVSDAQFSDWFPDYYAGHRTAYTEAHLVVYSDTIEGLDQVRYHVVVGKDHPVYALCVDRKTGQSVWYLQETTTARDLASRK